MLEDDIVITGNRAIARSYAKINLTLDVLGRRENGYHDVLMIMQTISLFDLLIIDKTDGEISVSTNLRYLPNNEKNIAYKAVMLFKEAMDIHGGAKIIMHKNIPVAAGLAGGSGNAAAVLCALNLLYDTNLSADELLSLCAKLGADVPYCVMGGTYLASGIGEILKPLSPAPEAYVLLVKPPISISTQTIYEQIDSAPIEKHPDTDAVISALKNGDLRAIASGLCNVMETVTETTHPEVRGIKNKMILNGALGAVMSGSGPTVFGLFDDYKTAKASADSFSHQYKDVYVAKIYN